MSDDIPLAQRLTRLLDHLGLKRTHVATQMPGDLAGLMAAAPERIAGIALVTPTRLDPAPFEAAQARLLMISGDGGISAETTSRAGQRLPQSKRHVLAGYEAPGWADVVADRTEEIVTTLTGFLGRLPAPDSPTATVPRQGEHAGLTYRIDGQGPALLLLPFFLAPSQWGPAIAALGRHFTLIRLGGAHIGGVAALEDRARYPTYQAMFRTLIDLMAPRPGETILDVGCGSGALDRLLAERVAGANPITAMDLNPFLLSEAAALARARGLGEAIRFVEGSAEVLPFPDASFDCAFSVTVLEECDADKAIAEMKRVVRPGGRIGIIVRAIDVAQWWSVKVPEAMRPKVDVPAQSVGRGGVADASLYARMRRAGLERLVPFPSLVTLDRPDGPIWRYREDHVLSQLTQEETRTWMALRTAAAAEGLLISAHVMHCAVATRPAD